MTTKPAEALADEIEQQIPDNRDWITVQFPASQRAEIITALRTPNVAAGPSAPDGAKEPIHYLGAIKVRLELLYEHSTQDARLLEHLSDEVDWIDAEIDRLRTHDAAQPTPLPPNGGWTKQEIASGPMLLINYSTSRLAG